MSRFSPWRARPSEAVRELLDARSLEFVFQPIVDLRNGRTVGVEGLTRWPDGQGSVESLFALAATEGLQLELELHAIEALLERAVVVPADVYVAVNASPSTVMSGRLDELLRAFPARRLVVEVTEREPIPSYVTINAALADLRHKGVRLAVDDAGAGEASLRHLLNLRPDIIKLDANLTDAIEGDLSQRAMARALAAFGAETGASVVAEGVETTAMAVELAGLGVDHGQGWALGRPVAAERSRTVAGKT